MTKWREKIDRELGAPKWNAALEQKILSRQKKRFNWQYPAVLAAITCVLVVLYLTYSAEPDRPLQIAAQPLEQVMEESNVSHFYVSKLETSSGDYYVRDSAFYIGTKRNDTDAEKMQYLLNNLVLSNNGSTEDILNDVIVVMDNGQQLKLKFYKNGYHTILVEDVQTKLFYYIENVSQDEVLELLPSVVDSRIAVNAFMLIVIGLFIGIELLLYRWKQPAKLRLIFWEFGLLFVVWVQFAQIFTMSIIPHIVLYASYFLTFLLLQFTIVRNTDSNRRVFLVEAIKAAGFSILFIGFITWL